MRVLFLLLMVGIFAVTVSAQTPSQDIEDLRGIKEIAIIVEPLGGDAPSSGLTPKAIESAVVLRLKQSGITVVPMDKNIEGVLYVGITASKDDDSGAFAYSVNLQLMQAVLLRRNPKYVTLASTWDMNAVGFAGKDKSADIRENLLDQIDTFAKDFLIANPRRSGDK